MQLFSADAIVFSKKKLGFHYDPEKMKKRPQKLLIIAPNFFMYLPGCPNRNPISPKAA